MLPSVLPLVKMVNVLNRTFANVIKYQQKHLQDLLVQLAANLFAWQSTNGDPSAIGNVIVLTTAIVARAPANVFVGSVGEGPIALKSAHHK